MSVEAQERALGAMTNGRSRLRTFILAFSVFWIALCVVLSIFADHLQVSAFDAVDLRARLMPPVWLGGDWLHPLGTDELGRDVLSRVIVSLRISFAFAFAGTLVSAIFGTLMGFAAAHWRGLVDDIVMVAIDAQASLPFFMVALVLIAIFGSSIPLFIFLLGLYGWERYAKLARAMAMSASAQGYAEALRGLGAGPIRIYGLHILPNILSALIVNASLNFPEIILLESSLSFLGLGIQPPMTSLGTMLGFGRGYLVSAWWIAVFPAIVVFLSTLCIGIGGDWLRDRLDPLQRRE